MSKKSGAFTVCIWIYARAYNLTNKVIGPVRNSILVNTSMLF